MILQHASGLQQTCHRCPPEPGVGWHKHMSKIQTQTSPLCTRFKHYGFCHHKVNLKIARISFTLDRFWGIMGVCICVESIGLSGEGPGSETASAIWKLGNLFHPTLPVIRRRRSHLSGAYARVSKRSHTGKWKKPQSW